MFHVITFVYYYLLKINKTFYSLVIWQSAQTIENTEKSTKLNCTSREGIQHNVRNTVFVSLQAINLYFIAIRNNIETTLVFLHAALYKILCCNTCNPLYLRPKQWLQRRCSPATGPWNELSQSGNYAKFLSKYCVSLKWTSRKGCSTLLY